MLLYFWWKYKLVQLLLSTVWRFIKKLKIQLPEDPEILFLGMYPEKENPLIQRDICTPVFMVALFTVAKIRK